MDYIKEVVESLVKNGIFGNGEFVSVNCENDNGDSNFASSIVLVDIIVKYGFENKVHKAVVKLSLNSIGAQEILMIKELFKNEFIMYKELLPLLNVEKYSIFPEFYYGYVGNDDISKDIIILKDLSPDGYVLSPHKFILDYAHISLTMDKLGKFHALSHISKKKYPDKLIQLSKKLSKSKFENEKNDTLQHICEATMRRGIEPILDQENTEVLKILWEKSSSVKNMVEKIFKPEEPYSVLCHGDFNRNNIFFKYDQNQPNDVKFFDLQTPLYTTPAVDLSFILYMNTTKEDRDQHWYDYIQTYWKGFTSICPQPGFTYDEFYKHFSKNAIFGYIPCSFFLPFMMEDDAMTVGDMDNMSIEEKIKIMKERAGTQGTTAIADIVEHLLKNKYVEAFINREELTF